MDNLLHYGIKRKSGRYPWGSGEDPNQHESSFLRQYESLKAKGLSEVKIAEAMNMNTTQLRNTRTWARKEQREILERETRSMFEQGMTKTAIGEKLGISEATVRNYLAPKEKVQKMQLDNVAKAIEEGVGRTGYLDVGVGVERQLGVSRTKFNAVVNKLVKDDGYHIHEVFVKRLNDPTKHTTVKVLTKEADRSKVYENTAKIKHLDYQSDDNALTMKRLGKPAMIDLKRIEVRYAEDGGADKDGLIELRPGVKDLDLGNKKYAQVRIGAGEDLYLKGMAAYSYDKFPDGVDIIFNTNKYKDTPKEAVLKKMKMKPNETDDPSAMFGSSVTKQKGALNIVNEEGDWDTWSTKMSSQFLSKQPVNFVKERMDATYKSLKDEYDEINSLTNPVVKKKLMKDYIEGLDSKAKSLKAKGLPNTKSHVILPFPDMKPNEIYAPLYKDETRVVLVRHPHGGIFEIPELVVNNKNPKARKMLGTDSPDAVGIHPSVAQKLSGADFDGDTVLVIPNNSGKIKTSRSLKELKNFDPMMYKVDRKTITAKAKGTQMGIVSNLITDMTIKGASQSELARAVKHSMVVIDAEKHNLDYKQSAIDNSIAALRRKYQGHINPETGKKSYGASTLISRSKNKLNISEDTEARDLARDKVDATGKVVKKGKTVEEIAKQLDISESTVRKYLDGGSFDPDKYSSGTAVEDVYSNYVKGIQSIKNTAMKEFESIPRPDYSKEAAKIYAPEIQSLNKKLNTALLNAPRERQAQIMTNNAYYSKVTPDMTKEEKKKLRNRELAQARIETGAKKTMIDITAKEWEAIQARAVSSTKLEQILDNADMDVVRKLAAPKQSVLSSSKMSRAQLLLDKGYTYAEVANTLGVSSTALRESIRPSKDSDE